MVASLVADAEKLWSLVSLLRSSSVNIALSMLSDVNRGSAGRVRVARVVAPTLALSSLVFLLRSSVVILVPYADMLASSGQPVKSRAVRAVFWAYRPVSLGALPIVSVARADIPPSWTDLRACSSLRFKVARTVSLPYPLEMVTSCRFLFWLKSRDASLAVALMVTFLRL